MLLPVTSEQGGRIKFMGFSQTSAVAVLQVLFFLGRVSPPPPLTDQHTSSAFMAPPPLIAQEGLGSVPLASVNPR